MLPESFPQLAQPHSPELQRSSSAGYFAVMKDLRNQFGQPIGPPVADWRPRRSPPRTPMQGTHCIVEPIDPRRHAADLHAAFQTDHEGRIWTYMSYGPFPGLDEFEDWLAAYCLGSDPMFHAIVDKASGKAAGFASFLRINPSNGVIEVGNIAYSPPLQRTKAATEAVFLMMKRAFGELGYRRCEWKCDALNERSKDAAARLGFRFEGVFRQAVVYKGRNRDTAWYSVIDTEWPVLEAAFTAWLDPANFNADGAQVAGLADIRSGLAG